MENAITRLNMIGYVITYNGSPSGSLSAGIDNQIQVASATIPTTSSGDYKKLNGFWLCSGGAGFSGANSSSSVQVAISVADGANYGIGVSRVDTGGRFTSLTVTKIYYCTEGQKLKTKLGCHNACNYTDAYVVGIFLGSNK